MKICEFEKVTAIHEDRKGLRELLNKAKDKRIAELEGCSERLRVALGWFVDDERFQVAVGGNPNVVESMIAEAKRIYEREP